MATGCEIAGRLAVAVEGFGDREARALARAFDPCPAGVAPALHARGAVAVHSAAVVVDGRAVLVAGWSESGKTETALALAERGAVFLSDKWTIVGDDGTAAVFPIGVGVRGWVLDHLPRLRAALGATPRARLAIAGAGRAAARRLPAEGGDALGRLIGLADRVALAPSAVRRAYGTAAGPWRAPLRAVALLT